MDKKKREQVVLIILVLVLVAMLPKIMFKKPQTSSVITPAPDVFSKAVQTAATEPVGGKQLVQPETLSFEIPDPFNVPLVLQEKLVLMEDQIGKPVVKEPQQQVRQMPKLDISGVIWGQNMPIAFINDKAYRIGDSVEDAKIVDIDKNGVYFLFDNRKEFIGIKKSTEET